MKKNCVFCGVGTALVTPFQDGEIDYAALSELIEYQIRGGADAIVIGGTTGEAATLSDEERYRLFEFAAEKISGRVKLVFGTGTNDTRAAVRHTKYAEKIGCDGVLLVTPYYNKGTEIGVEKHYLNIAESADLPIILYNVPSRTGVNLGINLLSRLAEHPNIVAIKEASDSADRLVSLAALSDSLDLYAGNDSQIYTTLSLGGKGVISVMSNLLPSATHAICERYFSGEPGASLELQLRLLPFIKALFVETNPAPIKYAMAKMGFCKSEVRLPLAEPRESTKALVASELENINDLI